jgi:hypothetical protein
MTAERRTKLARGRFPSIMLMVLHLSDGSRQSYSSGVSDTPKQAEKARRERRLGAALRENLKRRRAQAKGRTAGGEAERPVGSPGKSHDSAGIGADKRDD